LYYKPSVSVKCVERVLSVLEARVKVCRGESLRRLEFSFAGLRGRACTVCGARRPCKCRERRLAGRALTVGVRKDLGGLRCLTLRYSLLLSVWVDPSAEHILFVTATRCIAASDRNSHRAFILATASPPGVARVQSMDRASFIKKFARRIVFWQHHNHRSRGPNIKYTTPLLQY